MTVKTTGAEFLAFYNDEAMWPKGRYHEDEEFKVDGVVVEHAHDTLSPKAAISITGGFVTDEEGGDFGTFEGYFKKWRSKQNTVTFLVTCDKNEVSFLQMEIKRLGGKI